MKKYVNNLLISNKKLIIGVICSFILLISGTYASWIILTEEKSVTMMMDGDRISFDTGGNITVENIMPVDDMKKGIIKEIEIYKEDGDYTAGIDLYLDLTTLPTVFATSSFRWAIYKNGNYLSAGSFDGITEGDSIKLTSYTQKINLIEKKDIYKLYLWIDASSENSIDMMNQTLKVNLYGKVSFYEDGDIITESSIPNVPELVDGMIPIRYNYEIDKWEKADTSNINNSWYDYDNKMWANAVLVTSESRDAYMNEPAGTTINEKDILAYYVWIPRYKYLLFNVNSEVMDPVEIQIVFEKETDPISNGDENGEYLSHPAFWWDNNSDNIRAEDGSEELSGIWVGKFETGGIAVFPKILPNLNSLVTMTVKEMYDMNKKIQTTTYLTEIGVNNSDAHMMKNTDWGAVAYLSHSKYGINKEVATNSEKFGYITGIYGDIYTYNDFLISDKTITSIKIPGTGTNTSTTGNIYGVYDMSTSAYEYVMGVIKASSADSALPYYSSSGFNASTMPELKYYNLYDYVSSESNFTNRILGDATGETNGWYNNKKKFIYSSYPWFGRGCNNGNKEAGVFSFYNSDGVQYINWGSRNVILTP